ncbi:MutS family DNA mismatch repair protein [Desulfuribacillus alkaliarsenatis]|uniref:DNA mismatch repair protein MutS n=1 Tax=Desulfuribacillus alkaliarsenatis TaxID=766136 RepID=A0A1E5G4R8_9FIRM|nr:MutS family DNA mismatch repair protein [Desulfuribacillus alkaliarsenatis]OEF97671.1 DNA mismatch repair protein MutS [Desulfuribacillus alkaliarsenatis]
MQGKQEFQQEVDKYQQQEEQLKKRLDTLSHIRLGTFLIGAALAGWLYFQGNDAAGTLTLAVFGAAFIYWVISHSRTKKELLRTRCRIQINQQYMDRLSGSWISFKDRGMDFVQPEHPFTSDLDVFGNSSLFQLINVGNTYYGRKILADFLATPTKNIEEIRQRQAAVSELATKYEFTQELQAEGMMAERISQHPEGFIATIVKRVDIDGLRKWKALFYILPALTIASIIALVIGVGVSPYVPLGLIIVQLILTAVGFFRAAAFLSDVYTFRESIEAYRKFITLVERESFTNSYLEQLKAKMHSRNKPVSKQLEDLEKVGTAIDMRHSALLYFLLNALLLWDYHCLFALDKWKKNHATGVRTWLETIGELEALSSLAVIHKLNPNWAFPEFTTQELVVDCQDIGHPLINVEQRVCNDMSIKNSLGIITGSNMSGKTTMLRTIGINLVLAYSGAPVCAKRMQCALVDIFTSMRITDDLNSGISSFYAELLRIKKIIEHSHTKQPMLFLIDEIFRGTNSQDRILGAKSVMKNLSKDWVIGLISTHDFELCDLENEPNISIKNYHFTEHYVNNEIKFDYKLRAGRCSTTNAKYLMKMVGIQLAEI